MVLKNAAIVIQPPLACINRDNARVGLSWGVLCVSPSSLLVLTSGELLKGRCAFFCPVLCPELTETLEPYLGHFAVSLLANRKK